MSPAQVGAGMVKIGYSAAEFNEDHFIQATLFECEKLYKQVFDRMFPEDQEAFMSLFNSHLHDGSGPITGIMRTNGLQVDSLRFRENVAGYDSNMSSYTAVGKEISRINQSVQDAIMT